MGTVILSSIQNRLILIPIARSTIFHSSAYIDNYIAGMQQSYGADFNADNAQEKAMLNKYYDHLQAYKPQPTTTNSYAEMAYPAVSKADYCIHFPLQLKALLTQVSITDLYLMQFIKTDLLTEFPFENFTKKNRFKRYGGIKRNDVGYRFSVTDITTILPLFFFSGVYDTPVIFLFAATPTIDLCLRLCDDGNLHYNIPATQHQSFIDAAMQLGFVTDGDDICHRFSVFYFNNPHLIGNTLNKKN